MWYGGYGGGCGGCACEPMTKEDKIAFLNEREETLQKKLEYVRKMKEEFKSEKPAKESK